MVPGESSSEQSVKVAESVFEAFNSEHIEEVLALTHADFELEVPPSLSAEPDLYRGHAGMRRYWESFQDAMEEIRMSPEVVAAGGDSVVVALHLTAKGRSTGIAVEQHTVGVWTIRDGKILRIRAFASRSEALAAVGLKAP
jgi:ketosteroid isomerase-like protein